MKRYNQQELREFIAKLSDEFNEFETDNEATYCIQDDKIRLYVGWLDRWIYDGLAAIGFRSTPKQDCDFVATYTPLREDVALIMTNGAPMLDEDQDPLDRKAERAERFSGYLEKRLDESSEYATGYSSVSPLHGFQSQAKADSSARKHERLGVKTDAAWSKANYWSSRIQGVISDGLYKERPDVRARRINNLESEERSDLEHLQKIKTDYAMAQKYQDCEDTERSRIVAENIMRWWEFKHPNAEELGIQDKKQHAYYWMNDTEHPLSPSQCLKIYLSKCLNPNTDEVENLSFMRNLRHTQARLAFERETLMSQGGALEYCDIKVGGTVDGRIVVKVNKSPKTKRPKTVLVIFEGESPYSERMACYRNFMYGKEVVTVDCTGQGNYSEPSEYTLSRLNELKNAHKEKAPKKPSLLNPTLESAKDLQRVINKKVLRYNASRYQPKAIQLEDLHQPQQMTMDEWKNLQRCSDYNRVVYVDANGVYKDRILRSDKDFKPVCKVRIAFDTYDRGNLTNYRVVVLTDKKQKPLPLDIKEPVAA